MNKYIHCALIAVGIFFVASWNCYAQERPIYTQYMFNEVAFNPAYAGVSERLSLTGLFRKQWVGIEGAPMTQTFSLHSPIAKGKTAVGLQFLNDAIGISSRTEVKGMYAYRIRFDEKSKLSMGIQTGIRWYTDDFGQLYEDTNDPQFSENFRQARFQFGAGLYYHNDRFYVGASAPSLQTSSTIGNHYFITSGYVFDLGSEFKLKPNVLIKLADSAPVSYDLNANLLIHEIMWFGVSYRSQESIGLITQLLLTEDLSLGYAFDLPVAGISPHGNGSHEISLTYKIQLSSFTHKCPRYF